MMEVLKETLNLLSGAGVNLQLMEILQKSDTRYNTMDENLTDISYMYINL